MAIDSICGNAAPPTRANLVCPYVMFIRSVPSKRNQMRGWIIGSLLLAIAATAAGEPARPKSAKRHVAAAKQVDSAPPPPPTMTLPAISRQAKYPSPFELDYATHLAKSSAATPPVLQAAPDVRPGAATGPLNQAAQVDSYGLLSSAVHPEVPPLVTVGDWNFSAAAHVPVTHTRDTGAAISAEHPF